jgi:hypothetical protein
MSFWHKYLEEAIGQGVMVRLKSLYKANEEKKFESKLKELEKLLSDDAKTWLFEQLSEKSKWVIAFDEDGSQFEIMTTNISNGLTWLSRAM